KEAYQKSETDEALNIVEYALKSQLRKSENPGLLSGIFAPGAEFGAPGEIRV
ncbi:hypothetical protein A2U01_0060199, partial [Trifolium medium]|nr:hypothetical protein [Trifolium medium]